tara:strand:- start:251 stop:361 length:111 start_codon:yes stop_codon:yes gene_type:complete
MMELKSVDKEVEHDIDFDDEGNVVSQGDISLGCVPS